MPNEQDPFEEISFDLDIDEDTLDLLVTEDEGEDLDEHAQAIADEDVMVNVAAMDFDTLSANELKELEVIAAYKRGAANEFAYKFLRDVKDTFETFGVAHKHYVLLWRTKSGTHEIDLFKRNLTVRISEIRKQANKVRQLRKFWVTFVRVIPVKPDEDGQATHWLVTLARMNEAHYRAHCRSRAQAQQNRGTSAQLMQKSIGVL